MKSIYIAGSPAIGIANSAYALPFIQEHPGVVDYIEIPFEQLREDPSLIRLKEQVPLILHCASLSVAGTVPPEGELLYAIQAWVQRTETPWLGEHLAFVTAARLDDRVDAAQQGAFYNVGYTVCPQLNNESLYLVLRSLEQLSEAFDVPLLLENPPVYFEVPGSTMSQVEFIVELCKRSSVRLLLDLAHLYITCRNMALDLYQTLEALPLDRVDEIHLSGVSEQAGLLWDDHAAPATDTLFEMLSVMLCRSRPKAITLEYNWSGVFPIPQLLEHIQRLRALVDSNIGVRA